MNIKKIDEFQFEIDGEIIAATKKAKFIGNDIYLDDIFKDEAAIKIPFDELQIDGETLVDIETAKQTLNTFIGVNCVASAYNKNLLIDMDSSLFADLNTYGGLNSNRYYYHPLMAQIVDGELKLTVKNRNGDVFAEVYSPFGSAVVNFIVGTSYYSSATGNLIYGMNVETVPDYIVSPNANSVNLAYTPGSQAGAILINCEIKKKSNVQNTKEVQIGEFYIGMEIVNGGGGSETIYVSAPIVSIDIPIPNN